MLCTPRLSTALGTPVVFSAPPLEGDMQRQPAGALQPQLPQSLVFASSRLSPPYEKMSSPAPYVCPTVGTTGPLSTQGSHSGVEETWQQPQISPAAQTIP